MILLSNHLLTLDEFKEVKNVVVRINMAHVKDLKELKYFLSRGHDVFLDYPKGRTKPPIPSLSFTEAIDATKKYENIKVFIPIVVLSLYTSRFLTPLSKSQYHSNNSA